MVDLQQILRDPEQASQRIQTLDPNGSSVTDLCVAARPPRGDWLWRSHAANNSDHWQQQTTFVDVVPAILERLSTIENDNQRVFETMVYYLYDYPWVNRTSQAIAKDYISKHSNTWDIVEQIKPSFVHKHSSVSDAGRKMVRQPQESSFNSINIDEPQVPWRSDQAVLALFEYYINTASASTLQTNFPFIMPTILNVLDDHDAVFKNLACRWTVSFVQRVDAKFLKSTGLIPVIWDSVHPCLSYLPPGTEANLSVKVVGDAIECLMTVADHEADSTGRLDQLMREGIINGMRHSSENVKIAMMLMEKLELLVSKLQINAVRHLKALVTIYVSILADPFGHAYKPLLNQTCDALLTTMQYCWMRMDAYKFEVLRGLAKAWERIEGDVEKDDTAIRLIKVMHKLTEITDIDLERISSQSGLFKLILERQPSTQATGLVK